VERGSGDAIHALLPEVLATIQPRVCTPYNHLAVPIKVMEYLSYGRPLVVTNCAEQARIVAEAEAGIVVPDSVEGLAEGLRALLRADAEQLDRWSANAAAAAGRSSWAALAGRIVGLLAEARP
jgi:glycosyltransferase involved in cell wall biosynthesis